MKVNPNILKSSRGTKWTKKYLEETAPYYDPVQSKLFEGSRYEDTYQDFLDWESGLDIEIFEKIRFEPSCSLLITYAYRINYGGGP